LLHQVFNFLYKQLFYGNFFIAIGASCLAWESFIIYNRPINNHEQLFIVLQFFITFFAYQFHRFFGVRLAQPPLLTNRHRWYNEHYFLQLLLSFIALAFSVFILIQLPFSIMLSLLPAAGIALLYNIKIKHFKGLRHLSGIKTIVIALAWALSIALPYFVFYFQLNQAIVIFIRCFVFIYSITIPFDIRDLERDPVWLKTLPQTLGITAAKIISIIGLLFYWVINIYINRLLLFTDGIVILIAIILIIKTKPNLNDGYFLIGFDGLLILKSLLIKLIVKG
jgi:hypothetical protein